MVDLSQVAIVIGVANGALILIRPIGRLHQRIDRLEYQVEDMRGDVDRILGASGINPRRKHPRDMQTRGSDAD